MSWPPQDGEQNQPQYGQPPQSGAPQSGPPQYGAQPPYGQPQYGQQYGQPPYGQGAYGQPQYGAPYQAAPPGTNIMAILSLVFAFVFSPIGIVLGHIAKRQLRTSGESGDGIATAGLIISYIFTAIWVVGCGILVIALIASGNNTT